MVLYQSRHDATEYGRLAQLVEHLLDVQEVTGSSPVPSTKTRASDLGQGLFCCVIHNPCQRRTVQDSNSSDDDRSETVNFTPPEGILPLENMVYSAWFNKSEVVEETNVEDNKSTNVKKTVKSGITFGSALAMVISYTTWKSVGWAIFHGLLSWVYVIYFLLRY